MNDKDEPDRRKVGTMERHIQTMVQAGLLAVLLWIGNTVVDVRDRVNKMEERAVALSAQVEEMKSSTSRTMDDRWRGSDHRTYASQVDSRFSLLDKGLDKMERRVETIERECQRRREVGR